MKHYINPIFFFLIRINFANMRLKSSRIQYDGLVSIYSFKILFITTNPFAESSSNKGIQHIFNKVINIFPSCSLSIITFFYY